MGLQSSSANKRYAKKRNRKSRKILFQGPFIERLTIIFIGIERLKRETGKWEKAPCWEAMKMAFGGPFSVTWCSPFSGMSCKKSPIELATIPLGEIIEEDVIEIPLN